MHRDGTFFEVVKPVLERFITVNILSEDSPNKYEKTYSKSPTKSPTHEPRFIVVM
jgi:hypothetical protein